MGTEKEFSRGFGWNSPFMKLTSCFAICLNLTRSAFPASRYLRLLLHSSRPFYRKEGRKSQMGPETKEEESQMLQELDEIEGATAGAEDAAAAALGKHIRRLGFESRMFSDITVVLCGKEYYLHKIVLCQSSYFMSMLSGPWKENGKSEIQLQIDDRNITVQALDTALAFLYGVDPSLSENNVVSVMAAGCFLCLDSLCDMCAKFIVKDLRIETFLSYQHLSERHCYGAYADTVRNACWSFLCAHAATELLHVLPKLSLQVLCRLIKSDETWIPNESERHKLAKRALIDWKLAHTKTPTVSDSASSKRQRSKTMAVQKYLRCRSSRNTKFAAKPGFFRKKASPLRSNDIASCQKKVSELEGDFQKLRRLWEDCSADCSKNSDENFDMCIDLFAGGGIIYAHMDVDELISVKKEFEDANLPADAINDSIWQRALLHAHIVKLGANDAPVAFFDDEEMNYDDEDEEEEEEDEDDEDEVVYDVNEDEEESSARETDDSTSRIAVNTESPKRSRAENALRVLFSCSEVNSPDKLDVKRRKTTSGFVWAAKPDIGMGFEDFPPFRFGVEFYWKDEKWISDAKYKSVFYGGSLWSITVISVDCEAGWHIGLSCHGRKSIYDSYPYSDLRKRVRFAARMFINTSSGLCTVTGTSYRNDPYPLGFHLTPKEVSLDKLLRVSATVQLIDS